jgi:hypothetical protein
VAEDEVIFCAESPVATAQEGVISETVPFIAKFNICCLAVVFLALKP